MVDGIGRTIIGEQQSDIWAYELPVTTEQRPVRTRHTSAVEARAGRVLVVSEDQLLFTKVILILHHSGYVARLSERGPVPQCEIEHFRPDLLIVDCSTQSTWGSAFLGAAKNGGAVLPSILLVDPSGVEQVLSSARHEDFEILTKPFLPAALLHAVKRGIKYTRHIHDSNHPQHAPDSDALQVETVKKLALAVEHRDGDTGRHIARIGLFAKRLAEAMDLPLQFCEEIAVASSMHDIGKIGIPDSILLKDGPLTEDEFNTMKTHPLIGAQILSGWKSSILKMAADIALTHHEHWDGSGYPSRLKGSEIPLEGRIVILADRYDAIRSRRSYKEPLSHDRAVQIITRGDGRTNPEHLDPQALAAFLAIADDFAVIYDRLGDR